MEFQEKQKITLEALSVMVIEDAFETRGLIKSHLKQFGVKKIHTLENGSQLLLEKKPLEVDVLLLGFDLGNCHSGIELIHELDVAGLLPVWCKVIFITNSDVVASSSHPFRYLKCEVLRKPINPRLLLKLIIEGHSSITQFKPALVELQSNRLEGLLIRLEALPRGDLSSTQQDELSAITMQLQLRLGQGSEAWKLSNAIQDELFRATNRLSIANALGDTRKLKMTMGMLQANPLMQKRSMIYLVYQSINEEQYPQAQAYLKEQPSHQYTLAETELYSLLLTEVSGLDSAIEFLTFKLGTSLENQFFRNSLKMMMVKCYLYILLNDPQLISEMPDVLTDLKRLLSESEWHRGSVDFSALVPFISCTLALLIDKENDNQRPIYRRLNDKLANRDFFAHLLMTVSAHQLDQLEKAREYLLQADKVMLSLEITPEVLINQLWFKRVFNMTFAEPERAREFNRIGIHHAKEDNPYQALKMFFQSHLCSPKNASIAINLLDAKTKLGLNQYWDIQSQALIETIDSLMLRENEQRKYKVLRERILRH